MRVVAVGQINGKLPEGTYIELVASLLPTLLPTAIMAGTFLGVGLLITAQTPDPVLLFFTIAGSMAATARLAVLLRYRKRAAEMARSAEESRRFERHYALAYFSFAAMLGGFGAHALIVASPEAHMLVVGMLFGYGAGVAAGIAMRPWIAVPSMMLAIVPSIMASAMMSDVFHWATGALLAIYLGGGIQSLVARYGRASKHISMRLLFATLARSDALTNLPNRLALRERFDECVAGTRRADTIAVHCLDLDRFKPVNDRYGHPTGDALLQAVSERLRRVLRRTDFASRTGGDEFVIVQTGMSHAGEADMLARRIARAIAQPYSIGGQEIVIGTSIGYALSSVGGTDLDRLVALADEALCGVKRNGGGIAAYRPAADEAELRLIA